MTLLLTDEDKIKIEKIREENENYISTINAAVSFISIVTWNGHSISPECCYSIGRNMLTSDHNKVIVNGNITPDVVIEMDNQTGFIVEIKKSLPNDEKHWEEIFNQLYKYDDDLIGWWKQEDESVEKINIVLLIHQSRIVKFIRFLENHLVENGYSFSNYFSIVGFNRSEEVKHYYFHQLRYGKTSSEELTSRLYDGIEVPIEKVFESFPNLLFFDNEPPAVEYTMGILWQHLFNSLPRGEYDHHLKGNPIEINIDDITLDLQRLFGHKKGDGARNVEFPQKTWIIKAMDCFVLIGLAKKKDKENYTVIFKQIREELVEYFCKHLSKKNKTDEVIQPSLFPI